MEWNRTLTAFFVGVPAIIWQFLFLWLPLCFIIVSSFFVYETHEFSLHNYGAIANWAHFSVIWRSLSVAFLASLSCAIIAYPVAYFITLHVSERWRHVCLFLLTLPFWINFLLQVYAWFFVLERNGLINTVLRCMGLLGDEPLYLMNSLFAIVVVMIHGYLPFMVLPVYTVIEKFDRRLIEASYDLGAGGWQTFFKVTFPLTAPGIKTGFSLILVMTFGEFTIPVLLGGGKKLFVGTLISEYFFIARNMSQGAAFMCASGVILLLALAGVYAIFNAITGTAYYEK